MYKNGGTQKNTLADVKVMLEILEASHVALEGEKSLDEAKAFTKENLSKLMISNNLENTYISKHVARALELPSHWRVQWFDVKWQIMAYEKDKDMNGSTSILLDLAKLNFNMVQATLQKDLRELSRYSLSFFFFSLLVGQLYISLPN